MDLKRILEAFEDYDVDYIKYYKDAIKKVDVTILGFQLYKRKLIYNYYQLEHILRPHGPNTDMTHYINYCANIGAILRSIKAYYFKPSISIGGPIFRIKSKEFSSFKIPIFCYGDWFEYNGYGKFINNGCYIVIYDYIGEINKKWGYNNPNNFTHEPYDQENRIKYRKSRYY